MADVSFVRGNPDERFMTNINDHIAQMGAWHLLLRAHDHVWKQTAWNFNVRYEASKILWNLCNEVSYDAGQIRCKPTR